MRFWWPMNEVVSHGRVGSARCVRTAFDTLRTMKQSDHWRTSCNLSTGISLPRRSIWITLAAKAGSQTFFLFCVHLLDECFLRRSQRSSKFWFFFGKFSDLRMYLKFPGLGVCFENISLRRPVTGDKHKLLTRPAKTLTQQERDKPSSRLVGEHLPRFKLKIFWVNTQSHILQSAALQYRWKSWRAVLKMDYNIWRAQE